MYRSSTSLLLRPLQLRPLRELINLSHMQHAWKHVERPGGSHTALDGKKKPAESSDPPPATAAASGASSSGDPRTTSHEQLQ